MQCLVVFGQDNIHPLAWLLHKRHRHVWCAVRDTDQQAWLTYDWALGIPTITSYCHVDYDLAPFLRDEGWDVIETDIGEQPAHGPIMMNNCVGHVKVVCAIRSHAITPHGLFKHLMRKLRWRRSLLPRFGLLFSVPGMGGGGGGFTRDPKPGRIWVGGGKGGSGRWVGGVTPPPPAAAAAPAAASSGRGGTKAPAKNITSLPASKGAANAARGGGGTNRTKGALAATLDNTAKRTLLG
jgi:hypothetical protein